MFKGFLIFLLFKHVEWICEGQITGHILGGSYTDIDQYPHAVMLDVDSKHSCICGGSILTQNIVLTAAHCFDDYSGRRDDSVTIMYGASVLAEMAQTRMSFYKQHEKYNEETFFGDIALVLCRVPIKLGRNVKRVAIMERPPKETLTYVCGWGTIDKKKTIPKSLKHTKQTLQSLSTCKQYFNLPRGAFCAGPISGKGSPAGGDSGGSLIIKQFIQIGIVSFMQDISSLVAYTNVSYYYNWIKLNAANIYCGEDYS